MDSQQLCVLFVSALMVMMGITVMIVLYYMAVTINLRTELTLMRLREQCAIDAMREERTLRMDAEAALAGTRARSRAQAAYAWQFGAPSPEEAQRPTSIVAALMSGRALLWRKPVGDA